MLILYVIASKYHAAFPLAVHVAHGELGTLQDADIEESAQVDFPSGYLGLLDDLIVLHHIFHSLWLVPGALVAEPGPFLLHCLLGVLVDHPLFAWYIFGHQ